MRSSRKFLDPNLDPHPMYTGTVPAWHNRRRCNIVRVWIVVDGDSRAAVQVIRDKGVSYYLDILGRTWRHMTLNKGANMEQFQQLTPDQRTHVRSRND